MSSSVEVDRTWEPRVSVRVLLVDDNPDDRALVVHALDRELASLAVVQVSDRAAFEAALVDTPFDVVITDFALRWSDGLEVLAAVQDHAPGTPVIMFTGTGSQEIAVAAMKAGLTDYVVKSPSQFERLPFVVRAALDRQRQRRVLAAAEERFRVAFRSSPAPMSITLMSDGTFLDANDAMLRLLGYAREEVIGRTVPDLRVWPDPDVFSRIRQRLIAEGRIRDDALRLSPRDGRIVSIRYSGELVELDGRSCILSLLLDVTEQEAATNALRASEARLRQLIDAAPFGAHVFELRPEGRLVLVGANEPADRLLGVEHARLLGATLEEAFPALARSPLPEAYRRVAREGEPYRAEALPYESGDRSGEFDVHAMQFAPGLVAAFYQDITDRRRADESIRVLSGRLQSLVDGVPLPIVGLDARQSVVSWNEAAERVFGWTAGEVIGKPYPIVPADLATTAQEVFARALSGGTIAGVETRRQRRDGTAIEVRTWSAPWPRADGAPAGIFAILEDITAEKRAAAALARSAREIESLYNGAPVGYHSLDGDGLIVRINDTELAWLGYTRDEVVGRKRLTDLVGDAGAAVFAANFARLKANGVVRDLEYEFIRKDGSRFPVLLSSIAVHDAEGRFVVTNSTVWDATERRAAEAQRLELEAQLRQAQKMEAIGQLAGGIAHDFNNLLTVIRGFAELHLMDHGDQDPGRTDVTEIQRAAERAAELIRGLLAFSRRAEVHPAPLDLGELVEGAVPLLRRLVGEHIDVRLRADPRLPRVLADRIQIEEVLLNLASNARDAMPDGGTLEIALAPIAIGGAAGAGHDDGRSGPYVGLTVSDTGVGMDEATLAHVFEPFFTTKPLGHGTGLGLATVYGIVQQAGGRIDVDSRPGAGATFRIALPAFEGEAPEVAVEPVAVTSGGGAGRRILFVEDEPAVRAFAERALRGTGYDVRAFSDPRAALDAAVREPEAYDALVTDVVMPGMSGPSLAAIIAAMRSDLPVLYLSGYAADALPDGAPNHLAKPFSGGELADAVDALFAPRRPEA